MTCWNKPDPDHKSTRYTTEMGASMRQRERVLAAVSDLAVVIDEPLRGPHAGPNSSAVEEATETMT